MEKNALVIDSIDGGSQEGEDSVSRLAYYRIEDWEALPAAKGGSTAFHRRHHDLAEWDD